MIEEIEKHLLQCHNSFDYFARNELKADPSDQQQDAIDAVQAAIDGKALPDISIRSGHGTGKTSFLSWLILWAGQCFEDVKIPCTAPVAAQLINQLIPEVRKWSGKQSDELQQLVDVQTQDVKFANGNACFARTARKENSEALAGVHASLVIYIVDEASGVHQSIFDVIEGALTGKYIFIMTSNPTRTSGTFFDSHNKRKSMYQTLHFSSAASSNVSDSYAKKIEDKYGKDSDVYRVRVLGEFPKSVVNALFDLDLIERAMNYNVDDPIDRGGPFVYALDVARFGDDSSQLSKRKGYDTYELIGKEKMNTMELASWVAHNYMKEETPPDAIVVDTIGVGAGVFDRLIELGLPAVEGNASFKADENEYFNKRTEMYFNLKDYLVKGGRLPKDDELLEELTCITYGFTDGGKLKIVGKDVIKEDLGRSPDKADSVGLQHFTTIIPQSVMNAADDLHEGGYDEHPGW